MPSDANGVYSLPNGYEAVTGETIQPSQHNPPLEDIATGLTQRLMRTGAAPMTGPLKLVDGSASSPSLQFNSDSSSGIYKTANGFGVSVGGTQVAEFTSGGLSKGGRFLGELIPYTGTTARDLTVLPYGQTLNRADYPDFWTFVQAEIASGNTSFNNGNGTTTFGIPDMRGRSPVGWDKMGGTAANRVTTAGSSIDGATLGATGGSQSVALTGSQNGPHTHANTLTDPGHIHQVSPRGQGNYPAQPGSDLSAATNIGNVNTSNNTTGITINNVSSGSGDAHQNMPPAFICNYLLFVGA